MLTALLSFFDEQPSWLTATVASLPKAGVSHLVAGDGVYGLYPNALRHYRSAQEQIDAITAACYGAGIGLTLHIPTSCYMGNELEKRNHMLTLARTVTEDGWLLIIDSDEAITHASHDLAEQLDQSQDDVAYYKLMEQGTPNYIRGLYRNTPDLRVEACHYGYRNNQGWLWDGHGTPATDLTDHLVLEHRQRGSQTPRHLNKWDYYRRRDELKVETSPMVEA
jgi:hypothetical protein